MPELRKDPVVDRWVIIASERARRPGNFIDRIDYLDQNLPEDCRYCKNQDKPIEVYQSGVEVYSVNDSLMVDKKIIEEKNDGLYKTIVGAGHHEVILETKEHVSNIADLGIDQISDVLDAYIKRIAVLKKDDNYSYYVVYKNYGVSAGSRYIAHARSHFVALPVVPLRAQEKIQGACEYFDEHKKCIYCDLIIQEIKDQKRIIIESENFVALIPFASRFLFEIQVLPKAHSSMFENLPENHRQELAQMLQTVFKKIKVGIEDCAYNFVIHTSPIVNEKGSDEQERLQKGYHWHIEIMPRLTRMAGFEKGTGFYICAIPPEDMADYLKGVDENV